MAISHDEREFFVSLGSRIAQLRKDSHITQAQLGEALEISQSAMNAYEQGQRRVPVSALPVLAKALGVTLEDLLGESSAAAGKSSKRGPAPKFQKQLERIAQLPRARQEVVMQMLDGVLAQRAR
jgi:transcriptional regulator with XRE-family HTH domain